jgi:tRNA (adenine22-N1)-methyltransferase
VVKIYLNIDGRLTAISDMICGDVIADIGSDHAYLPIWLYLNNKIKKAYAVDISINCVNRIKAHLKKYKISEDDIIPVLSNGFINFKKDDFNELTDIIIAGMGGKSISKIIETITQTPYPLSKGGFPKNINFILQPSRKDEELRKFLYKNKFEIISEIIVEENKRIYCIINAKFTNQEYKPSIIEIYAGKNITHAGYINNIIIRLDSLIRDLDKSTSDKYNIKTEFGYYDDIKSLIFELKKL